MSLAKRFIKNTLILAATTVLIRVANIWYTAYVSTKVGTEVIGLFQLILSVYIFSITIATSGISLASTRLVAEELTHKNGNAIAVVKRCVIYCACFCALSVTLMVINADFISNVWLHGRISKTTVYILCLSLPFLSISSVFVGYFTAVRRVIKSSSALILEQFVKIGVTISLVSVFAPKGLDYACMALVIGGTASEILSFIYLFILYRLDRRRYLNNKRKDPELTKKMLKISLPLAISSYIKSGLDTFKQIMIPNGLEKSGVSCDTAISQYGMIKGMVLPILLFPYGVLSAFNELLIPELAEQNVLNNKQKISEIISKSFKITLLFSVGVGGVLFSFANDLSMMIYNNPEVGGFLRMLAPVVLIMYFDSAVDYILKGLNQQLSVVRINIIDTILSIAMLFTLLPILGINGYIIIIIGSEIVNTFLSVKRLIKVAHFEVRIMNWIVMPAVAVVTAILLSRIVFENIILSIGFAFIFYVLLLRFLGIVKFRRGAVKEYMAAMMRKQKKHA